jgi:hypothetical protein
MLSRRITALLIGLLTIHLSFLGVDLACADHGLSGPPAHSAAAMATHHATSDEAAVAETESCEIPAQQDCCRAMASCALSVEIDTSAPASDAPFARGSVAATAMRLPLSQTSPPEPPPPRA